MNYYVIIPVSSSKDFFLTPKVISFLALMTLLIPRAGNLCDTVKQMYVNTCWLLNMLNPFKFKIFYSFMPFVMMHFVDLTLDFKGGHTAALEDLLQSNTSMTLYMPPCCCVGLCVRQLDYTKWTFSLIEKNWIRINRFVDRKRLRVLKSLVYQMPLVQLAIILLIVLLTEAEVIRRDQVTWIEQFKDLNDT